MGAEVSLNLANPIPIVWADLVDQEGGSDVGGGSFVMDPLFLGTEFDEDIVAGTIVGSPNALIVPQVELLGQVIIPEVRADTRTGARLDANISGRAGLELNAGLDLGGVADSATFNYDPKVALPDQIRRGQFFRISGSAGLDTAGSFGTAEVELPSASVGADVIFDVDAAGKVDYALIGAVPYQSQPFNWNVVPQPTDDDGNWTLLGVGIDLNTEDFATLTVAGEAIAVNPGDQDTVFGYDISLDAPGENDNDPSPFNRDIGRVEIVKPALNDTLFVDTSLSASSGINYSIDSNILRLGVDIDGIASTLAAGASYTDFSITVGDPESDINGSIDGTLLDLKYGPELGYKYESSIDARFDVTLSFDNDVAIKLDDGTVLITNTYTGTWDNLPEIALLDSDAVEVDVLFDRYEARLTDRGALTIGDYLEFQALAISASLNVGPIPIELASLGPAIHARTSVLGDLLGEIEVDLFTNTDQFLGEKTGIATMGSFTLPAPLVQTLYLPATTGNLAATGSWRVVGTNNTPSSLAGNSLVVALGDATTQSVDDLLPATIFDATSSSQSVTAGELQLLPGSSMAYGAQTTRNWTLDRIINEGSYSSTGDTTFSAGLLSILRIDGPGSITLRGEDNHLEATSFVHGAEHELIMDSPTGSNTLNVTDLLQNDGRIVVGNLAEVLLNGATGEFRNSGSFEAVGDASIVAKKIINDGLIRAASDSGTAELVLRGFFGGFLSPSGEGVFQAGPGGTIRFIDLPTLNDEITFHAESGGKILFDSLVSVPGVANFIVDEGAELVLNGMDVFGDGEADIVNRGVVEFVSGNNSVSNPGGGGMIVPVNLDNTRGKVIVRNSARLFLSATIEDYSGGGATFDAGEWEVIGNPSLFENDDLINSPAGVDDVAQVSITVTGVTNADNFLGEIDFEGQAYDLEDYDTALAINASTVTLSGAAYFPYFNTVRENRGVINLSEGLRFNTVGGLLNSGEINVNNGAKLNVSGDVRIHGGSLRLDGRSGLEANDEAHLSYDFTQFAMEIIGGELTLGPDASLSLFTNQTGENGYVLLGDWTVRESVEVDPITQQEVIRPAIVDLGYVDRILRFGDGRLILDGASIQFPAIHSITSLQGPSNGIEILGGFELAIDNNLVSAELGFPTETDLFIAFDESELIIDDGGKLSAEIFFAYNDTLIGEDGYAAVSDRVEVAISFNNTALRVDGVLDTPLVIVTDTSSLFPGGSLEGRLRGNGEISGDVDVQTGILAPDADEDGLVIYGDLSLDPTSQTLFELDAEEHSRLTVGSATLAGELSVTLTSGFSPALGTVFELVGVLDPVNAITGAFDTSTLPEFDFKTLRLISASDSLSVVVGPLLTGDYNADGVVDAADFTIWRDTIGQTGLGLAADGDGDGVIGPGDYTVWSTNFGTDLADLSAVVPEPPAITLLLGLLAAHYGVHRR